MGKCGKGSVMNGGKIRLVWDEPPVCKIAAKWRRNGSKGPLSHSRFTLNPCRLAPLREFGTQNQISNLQQSGIIAR